MGLQIRTYVDGQQKYIDLYENENVSIDVSFAEIQDITKKNSAYTKEFKIPGTNNNNDIFNYFFEINSVPLDWNPKRKFEASLIYNGYELFTGNIRLNMVTIVIKEKIYSVTFYAEVGDLSSNIGDKALCNIDTSSLNHSLYIEEISKNIFLDPSLHPISWAVTHSTPSYLAAHPNLVNPVSTGDVQYTLAQRGYDYTGSTYGTILDINVNSTPILEFSGTPGFFDNRQTPVISPYLIPSIRTRKLYELIVNQADYTIESDFFDTDYFGRYYVPLSFNSDSTYMSQAKPYEFLIINNTGSTSSAGSTTGITIDNQTTIYPPTISTYTVFYSKDLIVDNLGFNPVMDNPNLFGYGEWIAPYLIAVPLPVNAQQTIKISYTYDYNGVPDISGSTTLGGRVQCWAVSSYSATTAPPMSSMVQCEELATSSFLIDTTLSAETNTISFTVQPDYLNVSQKNNIAYLMLSCDNLYGNTGATTNIVSISAETLNNIVQLPYTIELNKEMDCTKKQIEFIQDVNRMFNLVVIPHPIKPKTLIIEPIVDWIGKGELLDWTDKVDYNSPQTLRPTTSLINGSIFAANKIDKDYVNTQYNTKSNKIYGQGIFDLGIDYKNEFIPLTQQLGQNTDYYLNVTGEVLPALPCYFISKETNKNGNAVFEYRPFRSLPRMVFKSVPIPSGNTGENVIYYRWAGNNIYNVLYNSGYGLNSMGDIPNINRLTTYPFAISGFSHYTTYNSEDYFTSDELVYPDADNQYDRYYRDYIEDLTSEENKIYTCKMYLTPWEVSQLYSNEVIFIKNAKFRINKITNLNLIEPDLSDVELVKLTRDYTPTPTLFYDLIECGNPCNIIHSNTDLNYLLWAFEGRYVRLSTLFQGYDNAGSYKTYKVLRSEYNSNYTYENVYFKTYLTSSDMAASPYIWNYYVANSCSGADTHRLDIINDLTGSTCECVTMTVTNTGSIRESFSFTTCSGTTSSWTLDPLSSITVCGCYESFTQTGFTYCPSLSTLPCTATPLPTPTPTPGLPTGTPNPTPTPTPTPTQHCVNCFELNITNNNAFECRITYYNCSTGLWTNLDIPGNVGIVLPCACPDIITLCSNIDVLVGAACN